MDSGKRYSLDPALRKKKISLYTAAEIVGILLLCVLGNAFDFFNMRFAFEQLSQASYWEATLQQGLMYSIALVLGYLYKIERLVIDDEEFARGMDQYHDRLKLKTPAFVRWVDDLLNPKIKIEYYRDAINRKLYKMDRGAKDAWKLDYAHWIDSKEAADDFSFSSDKSKRYCSKRFELEQLILECNIERTSANFDDYPRVNAHSFTWGIHGDESKNSEWKTENTVSRDLGAIWLRKLLTIVLMAAVVGSIAADPSITQLANDAYGWAKIIVKYAFRCGAIIVSLTQGLFMGRKIFESDYILVVSNRIRILDMFIDWNAKNGDKDDPAMKILAYLQAQQDARDRLKAQAEDPDSAWIAEGNKKNNQEAF